MKAVQTGSPQNEKVLSKYGAPIMKSIKYDVSIRLYVLLYYEKKSEVWKIRKIVFFTDLSKFEMMNET